MSMFTYKSQQLLKHIQDLQCHKCQDVPAPNDDKKNRYSCINESHVLCENHKAECPCGSLVGKKPVFPKIFEDKSQFRWHFSFHLVYRIVPFYYQFSRINTEIHIQHV